MNKKSGFKTSENGSAMMIVLVIVILGLIAAVGYLVFIRQKDNKENARTAETQLKDQDDTSPNDGSISETDLTSTEKLSMLDAQSFELDMSKLPDDWSVIFNESNIVSVKNDTCWIEVMSENQAGLTTDNMQASLDMLLDANDRNGNKGYTVTDKGQSSLATTLKGVGTVKVISYEFLWKSGDSTIRYSKAYDINNDSYISLRRACSDESQFNTTETAIRAIVFN